MRDQPPAIAGASGVSFDGPFLLPSREPALCPVRMLQSCNWSESTFHAGSNGLVLSSMVNTHMNPP